MLRCPSYRLTRFVFATCIAIVVQTGCVSSTKEKVERSQYQASGAQRQLETTREELAKAEEERKTDRELAQTLQDQLKAREGVEDVLKKRLANFQKENERLHSELTGSVLGSAASAVPVANTTSQLEPFRLPAALVGRFTQLAAKYPGVRFDKRVKVIRIPGDVLFGNGDKLKPNGQSALTDFAAALRHPDSQNLKLIVAVQVDPKAPLPKELEATFPTDWHLAANQAIALEQFMEEKGLAATRVGVTVQQYPSEKKSAAPRPRVEIYLAPPDVNEE